MTGTKKTKSPQVSSGVTKEGALLNVPIAVNRTMDISSLIPWGRGRKRAHMYLPVKEFYASWEPTCPPEIDGHIIYELLYTGSQEHYVVFRGMSRIGHSIKISITTTMMVDINSMHDMPYVMKVTPVSNLEGPIGNFYFSYKAGSPEKYNYRNQRIIGVNMSPEKINNLPAMFYVIAPGGDSMMDNTEDVLTDIVSTSNTYSSFMANHLDKPSPSTTDIMLFRYVATQADLDMIDSIIRHEAANRALTESEYVFLDKYARRYNNSSHRKFLESMAVMISGTDGITAHHRF